MSPLTMAQPVTGVRWQKQEREGGPGADGEGVSRDASVCKVPFGW